MTRTNTIGETISAHDGHEDLPRDPTAEDAQEVAADLRKLIESAPAHIWLDLGEDFNAPPEATFRDLQEVTWSEDNATGVGIKYVRAPVAVATSDAKSAPSNSLPDWSECAMRVENSDFIAKRVAEGGYGPDADSKLATELHRFIHEYDDADSYRSAWFLHRLEKLIIEVKSHTAVPIDFKQATDQGGWQLVPKEPTPEIIAAAALAVWPVASAKDIEMARKAAPLVLMAMNLGEGFTADSLAASLATMAPAYRAMLAAAPTLLGVADGDAA